MAQTVVIDIINEKVLHLLQDLEQLHLIRLHKTNTVLNDGVAAYKGKMTKQPISDIETQFNEFRKEWG